MRRVLLPLLGISILVAAWAVAVWFQRTSLLPGPGKVLLGIIELARRGLLIRHLMLGPHQAAGPGDVLAADAAQA